MRGFVSETLILAADRTGEILASLNITPRRNGHIHCPFPLHADRNPSWRWDYRTERWHCSCGHGDVLDLVIQMGHAATEAEAAIYVRRVLGLPVGKEREETPAQAAARKVKLLAKQAENEKRQAEADADYEAESARLLAFARELYAAGKPARGSLVEAYLHSRGIECVPDILRMVKYSGLSALCAPFGIPEEPEPGRLSIRPPQIAGVHLTFLRADGSGKAADAKGRSKIMIGRGHDFPLVLAPANDLGGLAIAEGIEDALTVHQLTGLGAWAAGSASRLPGVARHIPAHVEAATLIEDDNDAGRRGCQALAEALHASGLEIFVERGEVRYAARFPRCPAELIGCRTAGNVQGTPLRAGGIILPENRRMLLLSHPIPVISQTFETACC